MDMQHAWRDMYFHKCFSLKASAKRLLGRPIRKQKDNIKMDLRRTWCEAMD